MLVFVGVCVSVCANTGHLDLPIEVVVVGVGVGVNV